jgi:hypothetical protein
MAFGRIGADELTAVSRLCAAVGPDASVLSLASLTADRFAQVAHGLCDTPTAVMAPTITATVCNMVSGIQRAVRCPVRSVAAARQSGLSVAGTLISAATSSTASSIELCLSGLILLVDGMTLTAAVPRITADLHATARDTQWIIDSYILA